MSRSWGHVKLSRKLFSGEDPFWEEDREFSRAEAWIDLIQDASWRDRTAIVSGQAVKIERGQLIGSRRYLADRWNWSTWKVGKYLDLLEEMDRIERDTDHENNHLGALITIVNYDMYQTTPSSDQPPDHTPANHQPTGNQPPTNHPPTKEKYSEDNEDSEAGEGGTEPDGSATPLRLVHRSDPDQVGQLTQRILGAWIELYPGDVPESQKAKQGAVAKRMAEKEDPEDIAYSLFGMSQLYPYSEGKAWDLFDWERKFAKALAEGRMYEQEGGGSEADRRLNRNVQETREAIRGLAS